MIMMKKSILTLIIINFLQITYTYSQESIGEAPLSFIVSTIFNTAKEGLVPILLPDLNNETEKQRADSISTSNCSECKNQYYGRGIDVSINLKNQGNVLNVGDSGKLWLLQIESSTAYGMQFYFDKFKLPDGARLYLFNDDKTMSLGGYTSNNNPKDETKAIQFGTEYIWGKNIFIEYYEPNNPEFEGEISILNIIHIFKETMSISESGPFSVNGGALSCNINVSCPEGNGWINEISSVALILGYDNNNDLAAWCSGAVINNTDQDGRALFLTANHCIDGNIGLQPLYDYSTWVFLFNHQNSTCNSDNASSYMGQSVYGSLLMSADGAFSPTSDYTLLDLNTSEQTLKNYGVCYSGWTLDSNPQGPFTGIHHPAGDAKKISIANNINNFSSTHWEVDWNLGTTQGGSSGSPLFDKNHKIIGQVHYGKKPVGTDDCNPSKITGYGKFTKSWQEGGFAFWLDPYSTGLTSVNTYCSPGTVVGTGPLTGGGGGQGCATNLSQDGFYINNKLDLVTEVNPACGIIIKAISPNPAFCPDGYFLLSNSKLFISVTLCNDNLVPIDVEYTKWIELGGYYTSVATSFHLMSYLPSPYITFYPGQTYRIKVATSRWGWQEYTKYIHIVSDVRNIDGSNIVSDVYGKYITISNSTVTQPKEIVAREYIKILPNSTLYAGTYKINDFGCADMAGREMDSTNEEVLRMNYMVDENVLYNEEFTNVELNKETIAETKPSNSNFTIYPNPNKGKFIIELTNKTTESTLEIYDLMGKKVWSKVSSENKLKIDISSQPKGIYLVKMVSENQVIVQKIVYD